jgi:3-phenylpropionate/trans-cinnamate dioxygenase ferredoxin subunit
MALTQVASKNEILPGAMKAFTVNGVEVLVANCDGAFYALSAICTHFGGHLADGHLDGFVVKCPRHGAGFDVRTGANVAPAKLGPIKMSPADLKTYAVALEGESVRIDV